MAPQLTNWCGLNLKHGTIVIGVIQSILAFMAMILAAAYAEHPHELISMADKSIVPDYTSKEKSQKLIYTFLPHCTVLELKVWRKTEIFKIIWNTLNL